MIDKDEIFIPKIPHGKYADIEEKVAQLYKEQNICTLPIDPFGIIKNRGYQLIPFSRLDNAGRRACNDNDAISFFDYRSGNTTIVYNENTSRRRVRFTLMHEIGHIDLGHKCESELARRMADYYAGYALAPSPLISKFAGNNVKKISSIFDISHECAKICGARCQNWVMYGGDFLKPYEIDILNRFQ